MHVRALATLLGLILVGSFAGPATSSNRGVDAKPKPPKIAKHANVTVQATSAKGAIVRYARAVVTPAGTKVAYSKRSGTLFPVGTTTVTITATNTAGRAVSRFTVTVRPPSTGPPTTTTTSKAPNQAPAWPSPLTTSSSTEMQYDSNGRISGAETTITVAAATDADGDSLTYTWTATNGSIEGNGVTATWQRLLIGGRIQAGDVVVTADDGHGGKTPYTLKFRG